MTKKIGFLSFGHSRNVEGSPVRTAGDALLQHVEFARIADGVGLDGAFVRVHHFEQTMNSPFPLLSAMAAVTERLNVGTGVVDMRYENPLYMAEAAATTDLLSGGRLQLGVSRGSPEPAIDGQARFGYQLADGESWSDHARTKVDRFLRAIDGEPMAHSELTRSTGSGPDLTIQPQSPGLRERIWWGSGGKDTASWVGEQGMNLMSSTLVLEDDGRPFHVIQADQLRVYREAFDAGGFSWPGLTSVTRPVFPVTSDLDRRYFRGYGQASDSVGFLDGSVARSGPQMVGPVEEVAARLAADEAVQEADWVLFAMPSTLGVDYNAHWMANLVEVARELGWK